MCMFYRYGPCEPQALKDRMLRAVAALGEQEVRSIIADVGKIEVTCEMVRPSWFTTRLSQHWKGLSDLAAVP